MLAFSCNELVNTEIHTYSKDIGNAEKKYVMVAVIAREVYAVTKTKNCAYCSALTRDIEKLTRKKITFLCIWPNVYISRI